MAKIWELWPAVMRLSFTVGVFPTSSRTESERLNCTAYWVVSVHEKLCIVGDEASSSLNDARDFTWVQYVQWIECPLHRSHQFELDTPDLLYEVVLLGASQAMLT